MIAGSRRIFPLALLLACLPAQADEASVRDFLQTWIVEQVGSDPGETRAAINFVDLNYDNVDEAVVFISGPDWCGSGGCNALVLRQNGVSYDILMDASVTQLPIGVLGTASNGFRDLYVHIGGGGLPYGPVTMRFDGTSYPANPTMADDYLPEGFKGKDLIAEGEIGEIIAP